MKNIKSIRERFFITDVGYKSLKQSISIRILQKFALLIPFVVIVLFVGMYTDYLSLESIEWNRVALLSLVGCVFTLFTVLVVKFDYRKTNIPAYYECERLRLQIVERISRLPMSYLNKKNLNELATTLMDDCARNEKILCEIIPNFYASIVIIPIMFVLLGVVDLRLSLIAFAFVPVSVAMQIFTMQIQKKLTLKQIESKRIASNALSEYINGMQDIKANNISSKKSSTLYKTMSDLHNRSLKMETVSGVFTAGADVFLHLGVGAVIYFISTYLLSNDLEIYSAIVFLAAIVSIYNPVSQFITLLPTFMYMENSVSKILEIFSEDLPKGSRKDKPDFYDIEFKNVEFSYEKELVLKNISFVAKQGKITAIVGESGSGKSTIANLTSNFWNASSGEVTVGGIDLSTLLPEHYWKYVTCVFQDVVLFHDSIYNNILVGNPSATYEQVIDAAKKAMCDEFIEKLPNKYDTILAENGKSLSGGERQRLSIARAILKDSPIVILDEATSALDARNENLIQEAIVRLVVDKTVIVIAHRLRNIVGADKIIVLNDGKIVGQGNHRELVETNEYYRKLYNYQQESMKWTCKNNI